MATPKKPQKSEHQMQKLKEKQFLDSIKNTFKNSDLLKGKPPSDQILVYQLSPVLLTNIKLMNQEELNLKKATKIKSPSKKNPPK
ncbi:MAG: hypothetical protein JSS07_05235 [Proteobacteria bacterium]|nr:hypothetical protein [Pseudomonadota bacterium]